MNTPRSRFRLRVQRLLIFAAMGTVLHLASPREDPRPSVLVEVPSGASPQRLDRAIDEAVLVASALELGLPWADPFVRARIVADMRANDPSLVEVSDDELLERAQQLDLARIHPVVRARLAETMRRRIEHGSALAPPTDAELEAYVRAHADRYTEPPRIDFRQLFVAESRHGADLEHAGRELGMQLHGQGIEAANDRGDPTLLPRDHVAATPAAIDAAFGSGVGQAIANAEPGRWIGPVRGTYGLHFVFVRGRTDGGLPELATITDRVRADFEADRRHAQAERGVHALRSRFRVTVQIEEDAS